MAPDLFVQSGSLPLDPTIVGVPAVAVAVALVVVTVASGSGWRLAALQSLVLVTALTLSAPALLRRWCGEVVEVPVSSWTWDTADEDDDRIVTTHYGVGGIVLGAVVEGEVERPAWQYLQDHPGAPVPFVVVPFAPSLLYEVGGSAHLSWLAAILDFCLAGVATLLLVTAIFRPPTEPSGRVTP